MDDLTPMMKQYLDLKRIHKEEILFFRLGDFYEMFFDDAKTAARVLHLTLTARSGGNNQKVPMAGIPFHAADNYIAKLVKAGFSIAICEQTEDPATAKGLVKREIARVITPGTILAASMLDEKSNNYLVALASLFPGPGDRRGGRHDRGVQGLRTPGARPFCPGFQRAFQIQPFRNPHAPNPA